MNDGNAPRSGRRLLIIAAAVLFAPGSAERALAQATDSDGARWAHTPRLVEFPSADGLVVTADLYEVDRDLPTLLLFHQSASSRGEFQRIAPRVAALGFNALAVDVRWGHRRNGVANETARRWGTPAIMERVEAGDASPWPTIFYAYDDMVAAYDWLSEQGFSGARWALGSSVTAMLVFRLAADRELDALLAFSPAEYSDEDPEFVRRQLQHVPSAMYLVSAPGEEEDVGLIHEAVTAQRADGPGSHRLSTGALPLVRFYRAPAGRHGASILDEDERNVADFTAFLSEIWGGLPERDEVRVTTSDGTPLVMDAYDGGEGDRGEAEVGPPPVILLFHQGGGSARGEYGFLVPLLLGLGHPLLLVDTRGGGDRFGWPNRTLAALAERPDAEAAPSYCAAEADLAAARAYASERWPDRGQILWGSSFSAALVLRSAAIDPGSVERVLAFSPASGEPMEGCRPEEAAARLAVPALIVRPRREADLPTVAEQLAAFEEAGLQTFVADPGVHGSSTLHPHRVRGGVDEVRDRVIEFLTSP